jgi:hypothetical protein
MPSDPKINVRLETDAHGQPEVARRNKLHHYKVVFEVENAPSDTYAATFELDPETYYDPIRVLSPDQQGNFRLETTTYGDYPLVVRLHRKAGDIVLKEGVARGLRRARGSMPHNPEVDQALNYIENH